MKRKNVMRIIILLDIVILLSVVTSASASLGIQSNFPSLHLSPLNDRFQHDGLKIRGDVGWITSRSPSDGYGSFCTQRTVEKIGPDKGPQVRYQMLCYLMSVLLTHAMLGLLAMQMVITQ